MTELDIWYLALLWFVQLGLMFVLVFRFNFLFCVASFLISWAMSNVAGVPLFFHWAGWVIGGAQMLAGILVVVFGKKDADGRHLG